MYGDSGNNFAVEHPDGSITDMMPITEDGIAMIAGDGRNPSVIVILKNYSGPADIKPNVVYGLTPKATAIETDVDETEFEDEEENDEEDEDSDSGDVDSDEEDGDSEEDEDDEDAEVDDETDEAEVDEVVK